MSITQWIGAAMVAAFLFGFVAMMARSAGWRVALAIFASSVAMTAFVMLGVALMVGALP